MKKSELIFSLVSIPLDYLMLLCAAVFAYLIRYAPFILRIRPVTFDLPFKNFFVLVCLSSVVWVGVFAVAGLYRLKGTRKVFDEVRRIFLACSTSIAVISGIMFFSRYLFDSRFIILLGWLFSLVFVIVGRIFLIFVQKYLYRFGIGVHRTIVLGDNEVAKELKRIFESRPFFGYRFIQHFSHFGDFEKKELSMLASKSAFDELIMTDPNISRQSLSEILDVVTYYHINFQYVADLLGTRFTNFEIKTVENIPIIELKKTKLDGWGKILKRIFDIVSSIFLMLLFLPLMILVACAIKIDSSGPIFFSYKRVGQFRKAFTFIKFRSMYHGMHRLRYDEEFQKLYGNTRDGSPMIKIKNDPRITHIGRFIRRWSIDEIPQLFLVFLGSMSIVGPRPHEMEEVAKYKLQHYSLLTVKPGITGLPQVSGRSDLDFSEEVKLDTFYIENWSLWLDCIILLKTPFAIIRKRETL